MDFMEFRDIIQSIKDNQMEEKMVSNVEVGLMHGCLRVILTMNTLPDIAPLYIKGSIY